MPAPPKPAAADPLDDVESSAVGDIIAGVQEGDPERVRAALKDFVVACLKRQMSEEYEAETE